jgi:tetratricopeptide (TPR) repeat protein
MAQYSLKMFTLKKSTCKMKKTGLYLLFSILTVVVFAQKPSKEEMEANKKKLAEAQKKLNDQLSKMSPEARRLYDSTMNAMGMGQKMDNAINAVNNNTKTSSPKGATGLAKSQSTDIPKKQVALLGSLPKITTVPQYDAYLTRLKKEISTKVPVDIKNNIDLLVDKNKGQATQLNNLPVLFFMEQYIDASVYAAICVAIINKKVAVSQENLTAILHQSGYPQHAIPLLEYLNTRYKSDLLLSNMGQSYLSLGEKDKAKTCFMRALAANPGNVSANCGMGFIEANGSNPAAAAPYIEKVMKDGYSETLEKLASQKNIKLNYASMRVKVPEVFSPEKYKVRPCAFSFEEVEESIEKRLQIHRVEEDWVRKLQKANGEFEAQTAKMTSAEKLALWGGYTSNTFLAKKARFMTMQADLYFNDFAMRIAPQYNALRLKMAKMQDDLKAVTKQIRSDIPDSYEACKAQKEELNKYLKKTTELVDEFVSRNIYDFYDYTNQQLYWSRFLVTQTMYNQKFYQIAHSLLKTVDDYGNLQALDVAHTIVYQCEKQTAAKKPDINADENPGDCPFSVKIPFGVGSFKSNCNGWTLEAGEAVIGSISQNFRTGEFTIGAGVGGNIEAPFLGGSIGAQMFITVGSDFIPSDMGVVGSAGIEATAGPVVIGEEGGTVTMTIASGLNVDAVHAGQQINLLSLNPTK